MKKIYHEGRVPISPETDIPEAQGIPCRETHIDCERLNLLVPSLAVEHVFGGISTALTFFDALSKHFENLRIILTEQHDFVHADNPAFSGWTIRSLDDQDAAGKTIVSAGLRYGKTLAVGKRDRFIATAWWTAVSARGIQAWQRRTFGAGENSPFVYLIQDYEPGFYPWSSRYALAESTYHDSQDFIAVINSSALRDFFIGEGYRFPAVYTFEPTLHPGLKAALLRDEPPLARKNRILVYGRPGVARNAFELIVMGLQRWIARNSSNDWEIVSAGEPHAPVDLGRGKSMVSLGKLSLEEYARALKQCRVGISLMISPHPSYPPLEMAAFGLQVVTNRYKGKDLSKMYAAIHSMECLSAESIAETINRVATGTFSPEPRESSLAWDSYLRADSGFDEIASEVRHCLGRIR